jgi:hypothetical protein
MGLKRFFSRWTKGEDARALERADEETRMTPEERDVAEEDYEARKDDMRTAGTSYAGFDATEVARNEVDDDPAL